MVSDSTTRFSDRVADYVSARPSYPPAAIGHLREVLELKGNRVVADVGSGTGILTRLLLDTGVSVVAIEPNGPMRESAEEWLGAEPRFRSVAATAESTGLEDDSVDAAVAGQAFHWFDPERTRSEWRRILRPPFPAALMWNSRLEGGTSFLEGYERILREYATDYAEVRHRAVPEGTFERFFGPTLRKVEFPNAQRLDYDGLARRLMSSSYAPKAADPRHTPMMAALRALFDATQEDGFVDLAYRTEIFSGEVQS